MSIRKLPDAAIYDPNQVLDAIMEKLQLKTRPCRARWKSRHP
jgi:hypothetical protein